MCRKCGYVYIKEQAPTEEGIKLGHTQGQSKIITGKRKKKWYSQDGSLITDPDLIHLAKQGNTIISYREELPK